MRHRPATWRRAAFASAVAVAIGVPPHTLSGQTSRLVVPRERDVMIKTRESVAAPGSTVATNIVYLKGAWQRREQLLEFPGRGQSIHARVTLARCDERRMIDLNPQERTYASVHVPGDHRRIWPRWSRGTPAEPSGAPVEVTIDVVDTGERRQLGSRTARRVITTKTTDASPQANARSSVVVEDAWYIDAPPPACIESGGERVTVLSGSVVRPGSLPDRVHITFRGTPPRGLVIESTTTRKSSEPRPDHRVVLLEYSEATVDRSLFDVPQTYRPALPRLSGGYDLTRTDTVANRARECWEELAAWARGWWYYR
jgi:hypothetical protein